ncbi:hypothetical protein RB653_003669 [Dictyostelium firmibasis]|uniref:Uncharacterized protein n=1 Tax=Dictyostelium firmibasis TaxID=79012 RepID=A0AAN7U652_9MYCE
MEYSEEDFGLSNIGLIDDIRIKVNKIPTVEYTPKFDSKLWFMNNKENKDNNNLNKKQQEKNRKDGIKNSQFKIDYLYSRGQYKECINELNHLKTLVKLKKKQDYNDDIIDTEIRCNFKLNNFDKVIELIANVEKTLQLKNGLTYQFKDTNLIFILAQSLHLKKQYEQSRIQYHKCISLNRRIWEWWLNLSLTYLNCSNIIKKQNLSLLFIEKLKENNIEVNNNNNNNCNNEEKENEIELIVNLNEIINENQIKENGISFLNHILAYRSLCHSIFLLTQTIQSKRKSFKSTLGFKQLEKMKLVLDSLLNLVSISMANGEPSSIINEDLIANSLERLRKDSNDNHFEIKWLIDFKPENFKNDEDDEIEDREENPFTL